MNKPNLFARRGGFFGCTGAVLALVAGCDARPPETDQISGLSYTWDSALPVGARVREDRIVLR